MHLFLTAFAALLATANSYDAAAAIKLAIGIYHSDFANTIIGDCDFGADLKECKKDISCIDKRKKGMFNPYKEPALSLSLSLSILSVYSLSFSFPYFLCSFTLCSQYVFVCHF